MPLLVISSRTCENFCWLCYLKLGMMNCRGVSTQAANTAANPLMLGVQGNKIQSCLIHLLYNIYLSSVRNICRSLFHGPFEIHKSKTRLNMSTLVRRGNDALSCALTSSMCKHGMAVDSHFPAKPSVRGKMACFFSLSLSQVSYSCSIFVE